MRECICESGKITTDGNYFTWEYRGESGKMIDCNYFILECRGKSWKITTYGNYFTWEYRGESRNITADGNYFIWDDKEYNVYGRIVTKIKKGVFIL